MKELIFVRHAKSDWSIKDQIDEDRFLNKRGYKEAYYVGNWFTKNKSNPDFIFTSTAIRATSTALIFSRIMCFNMLLFNLEKTLYESSVELLINCLKNKDNSLKTIMLFGHNPTFTSICNELNETLIFENLPTCGMVSLQFNIKHWKELDKGLGKLNYYKFPENIYDEK